jgi:integrase
VQHKPASPRSTPGDFVFASRSGRPLGQRNVLRALRRAQELAVDGRGQPTFPAHHERDERVRPRRARPGAVPTFHSFRHTAASHAIAAGESAEEVSWQLGHRNSIVTRAVYVHELKTADRTARRRQADGS